MNILYLPTNIASTLSQTKLFVDKQDQVQSHLIVQSVHKFHQKVNGQIVLNNPYRRRNIIPWLTRQWEIDRELSNYISQADILHYIWGAFYKNGRDLKWAKGKRVFVEWVGSDIRDPAKLAEINPYYAQVFSKGYEYRAIERSRYKTSIQQLFSKAGAIPFVSAEMSIFLDRSLFDKFYIVPQRTDVNVSVSYPDVSKKRPLVVHSPTAPFAKGTQFLLRAIDHLKKKYDFEFRLIQNVDRSEALRQVQHADIFVDQLVLGMYGNATCEAMAFGKPVLCYIMPQVFDNGLPRECPVINTNPDTIIENLEMLLCDPYKRYEFGRLGRKYVESYHDASIIADQLIKIYCDNGELA